MNAVLCCAVLCCAVLPRCGLYRSSCVSSACSCDVGCVFHSCHVPSHSTCDVISACVGTWLPLKLDEGREGRGGEGRGGRHHRCSRAHHSMPASSICLRFASFHSLSSLVPSVALLCCPSLMRGSVALILGFASYGLLRGTRWFARTGRETRETCTHPSYVRASAVSCQHGDGMVLEPSMRTPSLRHMCSPICPCRCVWLLAAPASASAALSGCPVMGNKTLSTAYLETLTERILTFWFRKYAHTCRSCVMS